MLNTKKLSAVFLLVFGFLFFSNFNQIEASTLFPDTKSNREEILYLKEKGIINGYSNGNFGPDDAIKRVHAVQMILRELGVKTGDAPNPNFKDVTPSSYGYAEIAKAKQLNIISGKGDGKFDPNGKLTRGEMSKILVQAYKLKGTYYTDFKDVSAKHFSLPYVRTLAAHNISVGYDDGTFRPDATLTRAHFSLFMARLLNDEFKPLNMEKAKSYTTQQLATNSQSVVVIELYDADGDVVSQGSGFITNNHLIATNFHVISGGVKAVAITDSGEKFELDGVVQYDDYYDIALLKPSKKLGYPSLPLASFSAVKKGESVVAIGSPYGLKNTVSQGIVSGKELLEDVEGDVKLIQTTAQITFGSSGGPLLNDKGFVVGLNSFGVMEINFAVSSDYVTDMLKNYQKQKFSDIKVESFASMPEVEYDDEFEWEDDVDWDEDIDWDDDYEWDDDIDWDEDFDWDDDLSEIGDITPIDLEAIPGAKTVYSDLLIDAVHDEELPVVYGITEYGEAVAINYETKQVSKLEFDLPAESIFYKNGNLFITLLKGEHSSYWWEEEQEGAVAIVDATTFKTKKIVDIALDPYDIVADDTYFYVSAGSGQWTNIMSYNIETGEHVSTGHIRQASSIEIHPNGKSIYAIDSDLSPRNFEVFPINDGQIGNSYESQDGRYLDLIELMKISADGKYIFNLSGDVFRATALKETNMSHVTNIGTMFYDVTFNESNTEFYVSIDDLLYVYDYESFTPTKTYSLSGDGYFLFTHKGKIITVGEEATQKAGIYKTFIQTSDLTNK